MKKNSTGSKNKDVIEVEPGRKRLTVATCDPVKSESPTAKNNANRGLLTQLKEQDLVKLTPDAPAERLSFSSCTDKDRKNRASYEEKDTVSEGVEVTKDMLKKLGIGICCKKGLKPESPNQDSFSLHYITNLFSLFGVYDGHGPSGHDVSQFVKEILPKLFFQHSKRAADPEVALRDAFIKCQELIEMQSADKSFDASMSGCTVTMVYRPHNEKSLVVAHVGDSRAVLGRLGGEALDLTIDHKPNLPKEKERIESRGGRVVFDGFYNHRVFAKGAMYPGLNMSRALGDLLAHKVAGLSEVPDVQLVNIDPSRDKTVLLCTDGVWEFIDSAEAVKVVQSFDQGKIADAAEKLANLSWDRWMGDSDGEITDDITAVLITL